MKRPLAALAVAAFMILGIAQPASASVDGSDVIPIGAAPNAGSLTGRQLNEPVLGISSDATGSGYWLVASDGGIFSFGDAPFYGSMGGRFLARPMLGMAATASGKGYWMFAGDGGIFAFGDAPFYGSTGGLKLNAPVVAMTPTASNRGYWMVASDGGVFAFGDATFLGSTGAAPPSSPIVAMATMRSGNGYWIATEDGRIYPFGAARHLGDLQDKNLSNPVVGMAATATGNGYWLAQSDGQVWAFGDASSALATGARCLEQPVTGVAARPQADGLWLVTAPRVKPVPKSSFALDVLDSEDADLTSELRYLQGCQGASNPSSFRVTNPLPGASISSAYGNRIHPIYGVPQFHRGVDLAGGSSSNIRAAADGVVIEVATRVGYGMTTVIDHGGRIATLYGHQSRALVTPGDTVKAGQTIGIVGSTGFATGPHLHFEIRAQGLVINPTGYL
ncbi:MAG: M23 family metallopeptidase [Acidimicrobiia bacterium]